MSGPLGTSGGGAAGVTSVTAGNGITVTGTTTPTIAASLAAGTGVSIAGTTTLTVTNSGVTSLVAGTNVSVSGATGAVTVNAPAFGTTITASTIGGTAAAGTSTTVAREDHKHAFPAGAAPAALLVASTQATGTSASPALADHVHAMPGSAVAGASAVGDTAATGSATTLALSDHRHSREAFGTPGAVTGGATAASGSATTLARSDHVHSTASMPVLLASTTLGSAAASVTFSSISGAFSALDIICVCRSAYASQYDTISVQFNNDTAGNYKISNVTGFTYIPAGYIGAASAFASPYMSIPRLQIYAYSDVNWYATSVGQHYTLVNTTEYTTVSYQAGGVWSNTAAVTSVKIFTYSGSNFVANSTFRLYGIP